MTTILGIESSCDETAAAIVVDGKQVLSNIISSQIPIHRAYGGVVPEIASRHHIEAITPVVEQALHDANCSFEQVDAIAVAHGPGLVGSLLVGVSYAKALAFALDKPLLAVHHWQAHLAAAHLEHEISPPFISLIVSGSHSGLLLTPAAGQQRFLGISLDDAAGEAFDKIARALGLPYPGGPEISRLAEQGNAQAIAFPRAWLEGSHNFSFSGLKSAVLNYLNQQRMRGQQLSPQQQADIAASAQEAICDVLSAKAVQAAQSHQAPLIILAGGVAANQRLRQLLSERAQAAGIAAIWPSPVYCTDNAAMVAAAGFPLYQQGIFASLSLNADPRLPL